MSYQNITGTLNPGAHPGSYNGQDAYSDLLVTERLNGTFDDGSRTGERGDRAGGCSTLNCNHEQPILLSDRKGHNGITTDGTATTLTAQEKERPMIREKGGDAVESVVRRLTPLE